MKYLFALLLILFDLIIFSMTYDAVFNLHHSGWWFVMATLICGLEFEGYKTVFGLRNNEVKLKCR